MKEDYITLRKTKTRGTKHTTPTIGLGLPLGEFCFYKPTVALLQINPENQGLMFHLSKSKKEVKLELEEKLEDNYHLSDTKRTYARFTSKSLGELFANTFNISMTSKHFFSVEKQTDTIFIMKLKETVANKRILSKNRPR